MKNTEKWWQKVLRSDWFWWVAAIGLFLVLRLVFLTVLPVFADESIYIRWSQLVIDDPGQYLFFPMNDGKTPLQMWLMVPLLMVIKDPLWAGRFLSVIFGLGQMIMTYLIIGELGKKGDKWTKIAQRVSLFLSSLIPIWFFHQRMALTDGMLVFFYSLTIWLTLKMLRAKKGWWIWMIGAGLSYGLAFWAKIPAILLAPTFGLLAFLEKNKKWLDYWQLLAKVVGVGIIGGIMFFALRISPLFSQLFARGSDFLLSSAEVIELGLGGLLQNLGGNLMSYADIVGRYYAWGLFLIPAIEAIFNKKNRRIYIILALAAAAFVLPVALLGKIVYSRYYLPSFLPLTLMSAIAIAGVTEKWAEAKIKTEKYLALAVLVIVALDSLLVSGRFIYPALRAPGQINFTSADRDQYINKWSSGYGITDVVNLIQEEAKDKKILVLTEGYFGTLPDAINMYLFNQDVSNIKTEGIGQPVRKIPEEMIELSEEYDETWLVVNADRLALAEKLPEEDLILEVWRPAEGAAPLQVWDLKSAIDTFKSR